jgi:putative Mn2+ efflux pump MntP
MKQIITLILVGFSVGLSNFASSIAIGLGGVNKNLRLKIAIVFGLFETGMPIVGLVIGHNIASALGGKANIIGGSLLGLTGAYLIIGALRATDKREVTLASRGIGKLFVAGLSLSIDNLIVGFGLGAHKDSLWVSAIVVGTISVLLSLLGLELGSRLGNKVEEYSEVMSGLILIIVGVVIGLRIL